MRPTVLVVEDDQGVAAALQRTLRRLDATVEHVTSGIEALSRVRQGGIDLVLLDLDLPDLDGTDVCRVARIGGYAGGILVLTARHGDEQRERAIAAGADGFLNKPFQLSDLLGRARELLVSAG